MSGGTRHGSPAVALLFAVLVALALPAGLPLAPSLGGSDHEKRLEDVQRSMKTGAFLHLKSVSPPLAEPAPYCGGCHPLPPHGGPGPAQAFLNDHAVMIGCLVCHWAKASGGQPDPDWDRGGEGPLRLSGSGTRDPAALRDSLTGRQKCFDRGLGCDSCHRPSGMDRYARKGLTPQAISYLENLPDLFTLSKGAKWYFPQRSLSSGP